MTRDGGSREQPRVIGTARAGVTAMTSEDASEMEAHRRALMRGRLRAACWVFTALSPVTVAFAWVAAAPPGSDPTEVVVLRVLATILIAFVTLLWVATAWWLSTGWGSYRWVRLGALVLLLTAMLGPTIAVAMVVFTDPVTANPAPDSPAQTASKSIIGSWALLAAAGLLIALPWSIAEVVAGTVICTVLLLMLSLPAFIQSTNPADTVDTLLSITLMGVITMGVGMAATATRRASFGRARMAERVAKVTHELEIAREVHDSVFPRATRAQGWHFDFRYEPMQEIGGDYAFLRSPEGSGVTIAGLIDVTGHGIASALTVNRLHGEIDRYLADHPSAGPEELLAALNRYMNHTLSEKSIFATAVCLRCGVQEGRIEYASAGHPPVMVRRSGSPGAVEVFGATGPVLGVVPAEVFELRKETLVLAPGEQLLAFTDGILEAKGGPGSPEMLWVEGVRGIIAQLGPGPAGDQITAAVRAYRRGPAMDDVLVMEVKRLEHDNKEVRRRAARLGT
jgi:serine phosphatase RsbU (regulator of sigma subunit)